MTGKPKLFGATYSVYVRIVMLTLIEKGIDFEHEPVDIFSDSDAKDAHLQRHPFGKIPSLSHDGVELYETSAIARYIDEKYPAPPLMPQTVDARARVNQIISIVDNYAYPSMVWGIYVPLTENAADADTDPGIKRACETAQRVLMAVKDIADTSSDFLVGGQLSLADIYLLPVIDYFDQTGPGHDMINQFERINLWWECNKSRTGFGKILGTA